LRELRILEKRNTPLLLAYYQDKSRVLGDFPFKPDFTGAKKNPAEVRQGRKKLRFRKAKTVCFIF